MTKDLFPSPPPLTPPHPEEEWLSWLRLLRSRRVGPATFFRLMQDHGTADEALRALPEVARAAGVKDYQVCPEAVALAELKAGKLAGAQLLATGTPDFPELLRNISDAPPFLWCLGNRAVLQRPMLAIVGARNASSVGTRMARKLAADLSDAGYVIVSGLARGIDTASHVAAAPKGTLAVMAGGVDVVYPAENAVLAQEILQSGLRISEHPMGLRPQARHFPQRNRLISGLCQGVIVVEAALRSGSLITARSALDQGREVWAVPGHPFDGRASGGNILIRDGATLVRSAQDVLDMLADQTKQIGQAKPVTAPAPPPAKTKKPLREIADLHSDILSRLSACPVAEDQLIRDLALPVGTVAPALINLELDGKINRQPGGMLNLAV
ncbi:MAG: DNA-processing protein DprA [Paracoccaceae bacterium]